ncbi:MAG TPA: hypothetical protein VD997_14665 [Phycisphaerales bacterium]|nr:hypothetical protein [Phycisphaerales bacterium]
MTPSFVPDKTKVAEAVDAVRKSRRDVLDRFHLQLFEDRLELSFGIWILPAIHHANGPFDGYDMARAVTDIQRDIEERSGQEVTVFLEH